MSFMFMDLWFECSEIKSHGSSSVTVYTSLGYNCIKRLYKLFLHGSLLKICRELVGRLVSFVGVIEIQAHPVFF